MPEAPHESELVAGRYRVLRELARGGVGAVYEALDESTGKPVALKRLLHDSAQNPRLSLLFEAEYDTLARLRHPRIVEVFDYGIDKRGPYFTMELLDGRDLGELEPIPWREACRYLRDVASSLALLHTRRRLHRDLSPRNVRLTSDGRCRLLDFGTMANFGVADDIVGTPPMVPPEALRGAALDHRADLYSLGALAYRVLTARYAYRARQLEDLPELWRTPPARLIELAPDVPVELDELVMSMLSLDPAYRPTTTYEVLDRLSAIAGLPLDEDRGRAAQGYLVGSRLIGRTRQLESIQRRIARAQREHGAAIVIEGNPGVGKSRLLDEAALQAQLSGALTVRVDARAHRGDYAVANALLRALFEAAPHDAREAAAPYREVLSSVFDSLAVPQPTASGNYSSQPLAAADKEFSQAQLHAAFNEFLAELSEDRALVLLVDDLPRVDESSMALLGSLLDTVKQRRILLVFARRLVDSGPSPAALELIVARARRLRIHRLRREHTLALIQSLFGQVPNAELLATWVHDVTTGSPLQIMELCRQFVDESIVRFVDGLWVLPPSLPSEQLPRNLAATLSARAAALTKPERALAEALCVRRGSLPLSLCLKLSEQGDRRALFRHLDELVAKGVLVSRAHGYHFGQDALREILLAELPKGRARLLHLRLAEALEEQSHSGSEDAIEAGFNLILGGAEVRGADLLARTAPKLARRGTTTSAALPALEAALELYEKWQRSPAECLGLRLVMVGSFDRRMVTQYGDATLRAFCDYAGGGVARRLRGWLGRHIAFWIGFGSAALRHRLTPPDRRGPTPTAAITSFYRAAFAVLSVRTSLLDVAGTQRVLADALTLAPVGAVGEAVAETCRALLLALQGHVGAALAVGQHAIALAQQPSAAKRMSPAALSGMLASVYIGLGMVEVQFACNGARVLTILDALRDAAAHPISPIATHEHPVRGIGMSVSEFDLVSDQLRLAYHLARGERGHAETCRRELLVHGVRTGLQYQFDIWTNLLECAMSARAMDATSLRRTVEVFTHYLVEHPEVEPSLQIARAHLAHCLGKANEAVLGYEKWLERIQPGTGPDWPSLYCGYADALLSLGEAERAQVFCVRALAHPIFALETQNSCQATLLALLALAEAECGEHDRAAQRCDALLDSLREADHPLLLGFVHECAARIARLRGTEAAVGEHLKLMKRWYASTRNAALLMRAQRAVESLTETKATPAPVPAETSERGIVTRVTTRREVTQADELFEDCPSRDELYQRCLHLLLESAGGRGGSLYLAGDDGAQLVASVDADESDDQIERSVFERMSEGSLRAPAQEAASATHTTAALPLRSEADEAEAARGLWLLCEPGRSQPTAAVLMRAATEPLRAVPTQLLAALARRLGRAASPDGP